MQCADLCASTEFLKEVLMVDTYLHKSVFDWLMNCPLFADLFFIFSNDDNGNVVMTPNELINSITDANQDIKTYVDNSKIRLYTFTVVNFLPFVNEQNEAAEVNINFVEQCGKIAEWIDEQILNKNFPDFGEKRQLLDVELLNLSEGISASDENGAKYMFAVRFKYFDTTNKKEF